jgi:Fe-S-cluster containining protein
MARSPGRPGVVTRSTELPAPVDGLRAALGAGIEVLPALARFRSAQARYFDRFTTANPVSCRKGCSACCSQMVFDVSAVEIEDLGRHLRRDGRDKELLESLRHRRDLYDRTRREHPRHTGESDDEWTERIARAFWSLGQPCSFLDEDGACSVFEHRPQSCRRFFVHGPAEFCTAEGADNPRRQARMVEPGCDGEVDGLLELMSSRVSFDPEDDRLDHAMLRWLENRSRD